MLRVLGSDKRLCDGLTRRDLLQAGGISLLGLGVSELADAAPACPAKHVILLFLYGAASQLDTFDPKPDAPDDIRGPFRTIATRLPGVRLCEHLPRLASMLDRVAVVRSMSHPYPIHGVAYAVTGIDRVDIPMELNRHDIRHWPYFGSVLEYLADQEQPGRRLPEVPNLMHLPWVQSSRSSPHQRAGYLAGFLGPRYNPVVAEFLGQPAPGAAATYRPNDPHGGMVPGGRFTIADTALAVDLTLDRLDRRVRLVEQFDQQLRHLDAASAVASLERCRRQALSVTTSPRLRQALDLEREPASVRERFGQHLFGQSTLQARRLIEAGARLVSVHWDEFGLSDGAWDTHEKQTVRLRDELCPGFDQAFTALMDDLEERGLIDETLVVCMTEHGRTPQAERRGASVDGRNHWSECYSIMLAGAGIARGRIVGASDSRGAYPAHDLHAAGRRSQPNHPRPPRPSGAAGRGRRRGARAAGLSQRTLASVVAAARTKVTLAPSRFQTGWPVRILPTARNSVSSAMEQGPTGWPASL
jgi:hypothetical protein